MLTHIHSYVFISLIDLGLSSNDLYYIYENIIYRKGKKNRLPTQCHSQTPTFLPVLRFIPFLDWNQGFQGWEKSPAKKAGDFSIQPANFNFHRLWRGFVNIFLLFENSPDYGHLFFTISKICYFEIIFNLSKHIIYRWNLVFLKSNPEGSS